MYEKIMIPLDGSPFSEEALPLAIGVARRTGAELHLVHVVEPLVGSFTITAKEIAEEQLDALADRIAKEMGIETEDEILEGGAVDELLEYIEEEEIDLIVNATHGWGGLQRAWLGSTTDALVRESPAPILTVRPSGRHKGAQPAAAVAAGIGEATGQVLSAAQGTAEGAELLRGVVARRPLLPLDGSKLAESMIEPLIELVGSDAHYTLLRVVQIPIPPDPMTGTWASDIWAEQVPIIEKEALAYLDEVADRISGRVKSVGTAIRTELNAGSAILDYARQNENDLIAISTRGHSGIKRLALGSVADKVLRGADVPVLLKGPGGSE